MHLPVYTIRKGRERRVVGPRRSLHRYNDAVVAFPSIGEVVVLEVERRLGEPVLVGNVVHLVDHVEGVNTGCVQIIAYGGHGAGIMDVDECKIVLRFCRDVGLDAFVR